MARLTLNDRKKFKKMYDADQSKTEMAAKLGCTVSTIYDELKRGYDGDDAMGKPIYNPDLAQRKVNANVRRCGAKGRRRAPA